MAEMILICGSNSSGKSLFAEKLVSLTEGKRYYIATMINSSEENDRRIQKHIAQRANLNFETLELPYGFSDAEFEKDSVVLLEDVSNLLANLIFVKKQGIDEALSEIESLKNCCKTLVLVSISGLSNEGYDGETLDYVNQLNEINSILANKSDVVIEMENRIPKIKKGDLDRAFESLFNSPVNL